MQKEELQKVVDNATEIAFNALTRAGIPAGVESLAVAHLAGVLIGSITLSTLVKEGLTERARD